MTDSVALLLKELRLPAFHRHYQSLWETAIEKNWSHTDYLAALCEYELSDRYQRRTQKWLREAKLAANKTFSALASGPGALGAGTPAPARAGVLCAPREPEQGWRQSEPS